MMMELTENQAAALTVASEEGLAYAFWHRPGMPGFEVLIATSTPTQIDVFGGDDVPGFVAAPYAGEDGNRAWRFDADVLIGPKAARFRDGAQFVGAPLDDMQAQLANATVRRALKARPANAGDAPQPTARADYEGRVARAVADIAAGNTEKIVLSRIEPRSLPQDYDLADLAARLVAAHPHANVFVFSSDATGTWLVATPEVLLSQRDGAVTTMALAGTQWPPQGTPLEDITWTDKIVLEQRLVSDFIRDAFVAEGVTNLEETAPATVQAANLCHLRSDFFAPAVPPAALGGLLRRLHPTSAVCGMPRTEARGFIATEEGDTRGFYTGYFGPAGIDGETALFVNLRSARVAGGHIYLHVGGGIVAGSDPALEWQETVEKTRTIGCIL